MKSKDDELVTLTADALKKYLTDNGYSWEATSEWNGGLPTKAGELREFELKISLIIKKNRKPK